MIRYKTYNNVIETIKCVGEAHKQIEQVTSGDLFDIDLEKNTKFPLFHISPVNVDINKSQKVFNFQLYIMDLVKEDGSNEQIVLSDTLQIFSDLIAIFKHGETLNGYNASHGEEERYFVDDDFICEPFTERFDNWTSGWVMDFSVIVESVLDSCDIPINDTNCIK